MKIYNCLETKREKLEAGDLDENKIKPAKKYINAESEDRYFSFYEVQKEVDRMTTDREKLSFLQKKSLLLTGLSLIWKTSTYRLILTNATN